MFIAVYILAGGILGFLVSGFLADALRYGERGLGLTLIGALVGGFIGFCYGLIVNKDLEDDKSDDNDL